MAFEGICMAVHSCTTSPYAFHLKCSYCGTVHEGVLAGGMLPACCMVDEPVASSQFEEIVEGRVEMQVCMLSLGAGLLTACMSHKCQSQHQWHLAAIQERMRF